MCNPESLQIHQNKTKNYPQRKESRRKMKKNQKKKELSKPTNHAKPTTSARKLEKKKLLMVLH